MQALAMTLTLVSVLSPGLANKCATLYYTTLTTMEMTTKHRYMKIVFHFLFF